MDLATAVLTMTLRLVDLQRPRIVETVTVAAVPRPVEVPAAVTTRVHDGRIRHRRAGIYGANRYTRVVAPRLGARRGASVVPRYQRHHQSFSFPGEAAERDAVSAQ